MHCFSMQIVISKCFLLNLEKNMVSGSLKLTFNSLTDRNSLTGYLSSLAFGSVTSFFVIKVCVFCVFLENDKTGLSQIFFTV